MKKKKKKKKKYIYIYIYSTGKEWTKKGYTWHAVGSVEIRKRTKLQ